MKHATEKDVIAEAALVDLAVKTWKPGDGVTRYRFFRLVKLADNQSFDGPSDGIYTALGPSEALVFVAGYRHGKAV